MSDSLTVCPLTSTYVDAPLLQVVGHCGRGNDLDQDSFLMVEKRTTVQRKNARTVVERLEATRLIQFESRLLVFLGFGSLIRPSRGR